LNPAHSFADLAFVHWIAPMFLVPGTAPRNESCTGKHILKNASP
jgi:hypothetical protein